tara:strand:- start:127 stop:1224 length:1098 start_codon:yes stop_codon:yes gene_type:complete
MDILIVDKNKFTFNKFRKSFVGNLDKFNLRYHVVYSDHEFKNKRNNISEITELKSLNVLVYLRYIFQLYSIIKTNNPKIIHCFTINPIIIILILNVIFRKKIFITFTGLGHIFISAHSILKKIVIFYLRIFLRKSYVVFFQNIHDLELFHDYKIINRSQCIVVPGSGYDICNINRSSIDNSNSNMDEINILMIARFIKEKGIKEYVESAIRIMQDFKNIKFNLITFEERMNPSSIQKNYFSYIKNNKINILKNIKDIYPYINKCDLIVQASYREGLPRVVLEAANCQKPVLVSKVPGNIDVLKVLNNGKIFEPKNIDSLYNSIKYFLYNRSEFLEYGKNGFLNLDYYSTKNVFKIYETEYMKNIK